MEFGENCHVMCHSTPTYANDTYTSEGESGDAVGPCWLFLYRSVVVFRNPIAR